MRAGFIENMMPFAERKEAYAADITYGTNSEFGFDYLRDNMAVVARGPRPARPHYAIVDEVDSILIDEARTPLIISGEPETAAKIYYDFARVAKTLEGQQSEPQDARARTSSPASTSTTSSTRSTRPSRRASARSRRSSARSRSTTSTTRATSSSSTT